MIHATNANVYIELIGIVVVTMLSINSTQNLNKHLSTPNVLQLDVTGIHK